MIAVIERRATPATPAATDVTSHGPSMAGVLADVRRWYASAPCGSWDVEAQPGLPPVLPYMFDRCNDERS